MRSTSSWSCSCSDPWPPISARADEGVTLSIFVTLAMRPVGALLFGRVADRFGRRRALMPSVLLYSAHGIRLRVRHHAGRCSCCCARCLASRWAASGVWARRSRSRPCPQRSRGLVSGHIAGRLSERLSARLGRVRAAVRAHRLARHVHGRARCPVAAGARSSTRGCRNHPPSQHAGRSRALRDSGARCPGTGRWCCSALR